MKEECKHEKKQPVLTVEGDEPRLEYKCLTCGLILAGDAYLWLMKLNILIL